MNSEGVTARLVAWTLIVAPLLILWSYVVSPMLAHRAGLVEEVDLKAEFASRLSVRNMELERQIRSYESLGDRPSLSRFLLDNEETTPDAELRDYFAVALEEAGGQVASTQTLAGAALQGLEGHTLRVEMTANTEELANLLYILETQEPYLLVDALTVQASQRPGATSIPQLRVQLNLSGYTVALTEEQEEP